MWFDKTFGETGSTELAERLSGTLSRAAHQPLVTCFAKYAEAHWQYCLPIAADEPTEDPTGHVED